LTARVDAARASRNSRLLIMAALPSVRGTIQANFDRSHNQH
jgi:hypothetical protein